MFLFIYLEIVQKILRTNLAPLLLHRLWVFTLLFRNYLIIFASGPDQQIRIKMLEKFIQAVPEYKGK